MATTNTTIKFTGQFDASQITKGLQDIRKQMSNTHIGDELKKQLETALSKVEANIPALEKMAGKGEYNSKELEAFQKTIQQVSKDMLALDKLANEADFTKAFSEADTNKIKNFEKQLSEVENKLKTTRKEILNAFSNSNQGKINGKSNATLNGVIEQLLDVPPDQIENKLSDIVKNAEEQAENAREDFQNILSKSNKVKTGNELIEFLFGKNSGVEIKYGETTRLKETFNLLREAILSFDEDTPVEEVKAHIQALVELVNDEGFQNTEGKQSIFSNFFPPEVLERLKQFQNDIPGLKALLGEEGLKTIADGEAEKLKITQEQAAFLKQRLDELVQAKKLTADQAKAVEQALGGMNKKIEEGSEQIRKEKAQADALNATFGSLANRITNSISALTVFNKSIQIVKQAVNSVKELDAAFTQIAIVSEQSNEQAWQMFDSFNKLAKQYSITTKDLTEGAKLFYQQGLSAADTMKMVEASTVSAALGEVTMTEAANTLTAAIQGYNESAAVAMDYTDKIAMVGAVSAADFNELSTAMEKTASSAYTAGIDFDHLLGYLGKMIEVTREAPANLGTAMKTIIARFEDMKKDPMAILEDGVSANKVEAALATIGIALRNSEGEFRALQDVMDELGMKWSSLTRNQQAYIATVAAGSRQQSRFLALMNNYDRTLDLVAESQNSAGAAAQQYAVYQDSAAAATARLTAAWEEFYAKIVNSETIIFAIDSLTKLVETMSKVGPVISAIGASIGALGLQTLIKGVLPKITTGIAEAAAAGQIANFSFSGLIKGGLALGASLGKLVLIIGAVAAAIAGSIWVYKKLDAIFHKNREEARQLSEEIKELNKTISNSDNKINSLDNLLEKYDELNNKVYLTEEEQKELNETISQIESVSEKAIISIDKMGKAHLLNRDAINKELEGEKELQAWRQKELIKNQMAWIFNPASEKTPENLQNNGFVNMAKVEAMKPTLSQERINKAQEEFLSLQINIANKNLLFLNEQYENFNTYSEEAMKEFKNKFKNLNLNSENIYDYSDLYFELQGLGYSFEEVEKYSNEYLKILQDVIDKENYYSEIIEDGQIKLNQYNESMAEAAKQDFTKMALDYSNSQYYTNPQSKIITDALSNGAFEISSIEELFLFYNNFEQMVNNPKLLKVLDDFNKSDKSNSAYLTLQNGLYQVENNLAIAVYKKISSDADKAAKELEDSQKEREQFVMDNLDFFIGTLRGNEQVKNDFIADSTITSDDLKYLKNILKNNNFSENEKISIFDFFIKDNKNEINSLIEDYVKKMESGFFDKADEVKQVIIKLLTGFGIPESAIEDLVNLFITDVEGVAEKRLTQAKDNYNSAKGIYNKDPQETLTDKEYDFLKQQEPGIDKYISINEEGEKYLTILGKIIILENTRNEYANSLQNRIEANNNSLKQYHGIMNDTVELTESQKENIDQIKKTAQEQINLLEQENNLLERELQTTANIVDKTMAISFKENLSQAEQTYDNINKIGKALGEAQQNAGQLTFATAQSLLALDDAYYQYVNIVDGMVTLDAEGAEKMRQHEEQKYQDWLKQETARLDGQIAIYQAENELIEDYFTFTKNARDEDKLDYFNGLQAQLNAKEQELNNLNKSEVDSDAIALSKNSEFLNYMELQYKEFYGTLANADQKFKQAMASGTGIDTATMNSFFRKVRDNSSSLTAAVDVKIDQIDWDSKDIQKIEQQLKDKLEANLKRIEVLEGVKAKLKDLSPAFKEAFEKGIQEALKGSKNAEKALKELDKVVDNLINTLEKLDEILKDVKKSLKDIDVNYNPFTNLFEAWEHEWDYYYNIKRLIQEIEVQGKYIDNIISADYTSAEDKVNAYHAKIGNITAAIAANDTYITALRTGMSQTGVELMKEFGNYYKINPETGQIYQTDSNLAEINKQINQSRQELYDLQKLQNEKENNLTLEKAKLEALEKEKSTYESILSEIESEIDSLRNNEDIEADISGLEAEKTKIQASIEITESSIESTKETIKKMEDEIQDVEVQITLKETEVSKLENYVDRMQDKVSEYEQYWEALNETIAGQQERLQELVEIQKVYVDTAISTQQALYDAIVENYQDEINKKKAQYDQLKQLDNEYLQSVKESINKEKQLREDSNKQRSYQANIQRAQLLQMDTSGTFRSELASLNKEIKNQRQDLYDDLVDKQVEALEKEIENRHELYDKEVAALEERLAFMQENAILLWEKVNEIVAKGSEQMMSTLMNTTSYINSNELSKQQQRDAWEQNVAMTYDGVQGKTIDFINNLVEYGRSYVLEEYPEIGEALEQYTETYNETREIIEQYNNILNQYNINMEAYNAALEAYYTALENGADALTAYNEALKAAGAVLGVSAQEAGELLGLSFDNISNQLMINMNTMALNLGLGMDDTIGVLNNKLLDIAGKFGTNIESISGQLGLDFQSLGSSFLSIGNEYAGLNTRLMNKNSEVFGKVLTAFQENWNTGANKFTGYAENWEIVVGNLKKATQANIQSLKDLNRQYENSISTEMNKIPGSIGSFVDKIRETTANIYNTFKEQREKYAKELESLIITIQARISAAIQSAASAITSAAGSISVNPGSSGGGGGGGGTTPTNPSNPGGTSNPGGGSGGGGSTGLKGWKAWFDNGTGSGSYYMSQLIRASGGLSYDQVYQDWLNFLNKKREQYPNATSWGLEYYARGGLATNTGLAWLDGTSSNPERVLSPRQTKLFESMVNSLEKTANNSTINSGFNSSYNIGEIKTVIQVDRLDNQTDINKLAKQVEDKIVKDIRNRVPISINKGV